MGSAPPEPALRAPFVRGRILRRGSPFGGDRLYIKQQARGGPATLSLSVCVPSTGAGGLVADCPLVHAQALLPSGGALPRLLHVSVVVRDAAVAWAFRTSPQFEKVANHVSMATCNYVCSLFRVVSKHRFRLQRLRVFKLVNLAVGFFILLARPCYDFYFL